MTAVAEITARVTEIRTQLGTLAAIQPGGGDFAGALTQARKNGGTTGTVAATGSAAAARKGVTGQDVVAQARKYLGIPYVWGGTNPKVGLDCSGLVQLVYKNLGIELPRVSQDQALRGRHIGGLKEARPGDLLTFGSPAHHIGIYIGNGKMLHAPHSGSVVQVVDMSRYEKPTDIRRILPDAAASATSSASAVSPAGAASTASAALRKVPYADLFLQAGAKYGLPPELLAAVAKAESGFNPRAVSAAGAQGLMQIMPGTARSLGVDPLIPAQAVDGAARLLRDGLRDFGSVRLALAAYNAGPGAVRRYDGVPPYSETENYVRRVQQYLAELK